MDTASRSVPVISPEDLASLIGTPYAPLVLDVRRAARFDESPRIIATAQRCAPEDVAALAAAGPPRAAVVYCVYGHNVSEEAVLALRNADWDARLLAGGIEGGQDGVDTPAAMASWRSSSLPRVAKRPDLGVTGERPSRWITRERPKIDRVACPWLIRRFIDARAEFIYVPSKDVFTQAERHGAVAYDIPGAPISHDGELCSFDTLLRAFGIEQDPALAVLARIVRGADTDRLDLADQSAGLLAMSLGLSALHASNDMAMLEAAMPLYDALCAWGRLQVKGQAERHAWKPDTIAGARA